LIKKVIDNTTRDGRQRQLEAQVQVAFANTAGSILHFLAGTQSDSIVERMREFVTLHDAAEKESIDPNGIVIRAPAFEGSEEDEPINTVLRGALHMVAAMLQIHAKDPGPKSPANYSGDDPDYDRALEEISLGVMMVTEKTDPPRHPSRRTKK
jgi:hypothetical protein